MLLLTSQRFPSSAPLPFFSFWVPVLKSNGRKTIRSLLGGLLGNPTTTTTYDDDEDDAPLTIPMVIASSTDEY